MLFTIAAVLGGAPPVSAAPLTTPMASLSYFIGAWACAGVFPSSGKTIASTMRYESDLRGDALLKHHADAPPNSYLALEAWGYDSHAKRFNAVVLDNFGGARRFSSQGWDQKELVWASEPEVQPAQRFVYTRLSERSYRIDWDVSRKDGSFVVGDTLTCEKR